MTQHAHARLGLGKDFVLITAFLFFCFGVPHAFANETAIEPTPKELRQWSLGIEAQYGSVMDEDGETRNVLTNGGFVRWTKGRFSLEPSFMITGMGYPGNIDAKVRMRFEWMRSKHLLLDFLITSHLNIDFLRVIPNEFYLSWGLGIRHALNETMTLSVQLENECIRYINYFPDRKESQWSVRFAPKPSVSIAFTLPRKGDAVAKRRKKKSKSD
jgi:hypothetical protein